ncbi:Xanthine phosphoribosyltransferase, partial [Haemophilus influenzae]
CNLNSIV